ncbi:MAG: ABC transporter ATP-binding protein [Rhodobacteraceae bacterium]|nr:ABC transporter ATP-binding protein [Paracoccaceae bacterium]
MAISISLDNVARAFGTVKAVDGIDLQICAGEFFTLLGSSGSGKSTLLKILGGFEKPSSGSVKFDGADVTGVPANRRPCNTVFQDLALFPHMTVAENVGYGLRVRGGNRNDRVKRVNDALSLVDLKGYGERTIAALSGGQRQRVALARALVMEPGILLLDEPLTGLDERLRQQMRDEFGRLHRKTGATFILVTHNQDEALTLSDRLAVMHNGRFEQVGTPDDVLNRPANEFVARFVGLESIVTPEAVRLEDKTCHATISGKHFSFAAPGMTAAPRKLAIRPDRVTLSEDGGIPVTVARHHFRGRHHELVLVTGDGTTITAEVPSDRSPQSLGIGMVATAELQDGALIPVMT